ncbi:MAG: cytochrome c [Alphaproteobacteria bacterium]|nr:cytochrome c [Alphaproteobacteria bacterium]
MIALLVGALAAEPAPLELGQSIYAAKCATCHGSTGKGDGPAARALPQPPANFSDPEYWKRTDEAMVRGVIETGKPGTVMRGFPMKPDRLDALVLYLRSFAETP